MKSTKLIRDLDSITIFYNEAMLANSESYSPSASKPKEVVAAWQKLGVSLSMCDPQPVSREQFNLAHDPDYVAGILNCTIANGFGNRSADVAKSLSWTSGAMLSAAKEALKNERVAVAPCSGFHHAGFEHGGGFCTLNGLMLTATVLFREKAVERIGIIDLDQHWGDGTQDIIDELKLKRKIRHYHPIMNRGNLASGRRFLSALPKIVRDFADCDLVLFQAGADPHVNDPLGGWLTTEELKKRDSIVFRELAEMGIPVAWNLAGGYQRDAKGSIRPVLKIHENTMLECARVYIKGELL